MSLGILRGVPAVQINRTVDRYAMVDEEENFSLFDLMRGYDPDVATSGTSAETHDMQLDGSRSCHMTISNQDGRSGPFNGTSSDAGSLGRLRLPTASARPVAFSSHGDDYKHGRGCHKVNNNEYTVTGVGTDSGNVTFVAGKAPLYGDRHYYAGCAAYTTNGPTKPGGVQPNVLEESFDSAADNARHERGTGTYARFPVASTLSGIEMPLAATNNAVLAWVRRD